MDDSNVDDVDMEEQLLLQCCDEVEDATTEMDEEHRLGEHFSSLRFHLTDQLGGFGELNMLLTDLEELRTRCVEHGLSADVLEVLDEAMGRGVEDKSASLSDSKTEPADFATLDVEVGVATEDDTANSIAGARQHAEVLTCIGDYFSLFRQFSFADAKYVAALVVDPTCLAAQLGHAKVLAERLPPKDRSQPGLPLTTTAYASKLTSNKFTDQDSSGSNCKDMAKSEQLQPALAAALRCVWLLADAAREQEQNTTVACSNDFEDALWERKVCQCFHLLESVVVFCENHPNGFGVPEDDQFKLLVVSSQFLNTPAAGAIENLARRWFAPASGCPQPLEVFDAVSTPLPACVRALLMNSMTFCHVGLEHYLISWRANLCKALQAALAGPKCADGLAKGFGIAGGGDADDHDALLVKQLEDAAALACHFHFVGYCVPYADDGGSEVLACEAARERISTSASGLIGVAAWLLSAMYENPVTVGLEMMPMMPAELAAKAPPSYLLCQAGVSPAISMLLDRCLNHPHEQAALVSGLEMIATPIRSETGNPCCAFYDSIAYPPWLNAVKSAGVLPSNPYERWQRYFPWWQGGDIGNEGADRMTRRVLVAGCGSGHQLALELRTYTGCDIVALDVSSLSLACAKRKVRSVLSSAQFDRVRFVKGDIMELDPDSAILSGGFDVVICCAVLMCLKDPQAGLAKLAACMVPGGALHIATYSKYSVESWRGQILPYLRTAPASCHLYDTTENENPMDEGLLRAPSQSEARVFRAGVLALPLDSEVRELLVNFAEFFTYAGLLDLLFHPQETWFTLQDLERMVHAAGLRTIGVFFQDVNVDMVARRRFREIYNQSDIRVANLLQWDKLEAADPNLFGRMHQLLLEHVGSVPSQTAGAENDSAAKRRRF